MRKYIIGAGGTGAMAVRAYLCALAALAADAGNSPQDEIFIRLVDMDKNSDAAQQCKILFEYYEKLREKCSLFPQVYLEIWDFTKSVKETVQSDGESITLRGMVTPPNGTRSAHTARLMDTLYTDAELDKPLDNGFYGHPNIGAAVFNYVSDDFLSTKNSDFMKNLQQDLAAPEALKEQVPVYLFGSLFGGTGASVIPNLITVLHSIKDSKATDIGKSDRMKLGVCMLMPYFKTPAKPEGMSGIFPDDSKFMLQTQEALRYYGEFEIDKKVHNLLLVGTPEDARAITCERYAPGGAQKQHSHIVLLVAAIAAYRFLNGEWDNKTGTLLWGIGNKGAAADVTSIDLDDLGELPAEKKLEQMFGFSIMVSQFMSNRYGVKDEKNDKRYKEIRRLPEVVGSCGEKAVNRWGNAAQGLTDEAIRANYINPLGEAAPFCKAYIEFCFDVGLSGYDWQNYYNSENNDKKPNRATGYGARYFDLLNVNSCDACVKEEMDDKTIGEKNMRDFFCFQYADEKRGLHPCGLFVQQSGKVMCPDLFLTAWKKVSKGNGHSATLSDIFKALYLAVE